MCGGIDHCGPLVEDVTGKKIEHLIKEAFGRDFPSLECAISLRLAGSRVAYAAFRAAYFPKIVANYVNTRQISERHRARSRIVNSMSHARVHLVRKQSR